MKRFLTTAITALALAGPAYANVFVNGPKGCDYIESWDQYGAIYTQDEDHTILTGGELSAIEWFCAFQNPFDPYMEEGEVQIQAGYCMEPGFIEPGVFTLMERSDGTVQLDSSRWDDPLILTICRAP
ncbi:MAG: hypothetical protein ACRBCL_05605 [Maritimibacter sp.]